MLRIILKSLTAIITAVLLLNVFFLNAHAKPVLTVTLFWGEGCPHCAKEKVFLNTLSDKYQDELKIVDYEIYNNQENSQLFTKVIDYFNIDLAGVPLLLVGEEPIIGYGSDTTTGLEIEREIKRCLEIGCPDKMQDILSNTNNQDITSNKQIESSETAVNTDNTQSLAVNLPLLGEIDLKSISLPLATLTIAFVDGFNPCAMWILIFLITMLINLKDKKKLYTLGTVFIATSGIVYFTFLAAWFNFFKFVGYVYWIKVVIGIVAIVSGYLHIKNALTSKGECKATDETQREKIIDRIKRILAEKNYLLAIVGIILLAVSVNLIELVCSAGLPAIYTNLLATVNLSTTEYYGYLLFYVIIFMLDDLLIFFIAIKTFEVTGIAKKYTKLTSIVGGIIILIIGIILIFKPELLMFG